ncbi:MAG: hypothetical protein HN368_10205 [Spirochaetales bacterium]|nr:hypothetical protein [Spirochaetales bacterium]
MYGFPHLDLDPETRGAIGPVFRSDWLEETGQSLPVSMEEWETVLRSFKDYNFDTNGDFTKYPLYIISFISPDTGNIAFPYLTESNIFAGAYGTSHSFYMDGELVRFGPIEPAYRQMLRTLAGWYAEGLINPSLAAAPRAIGSRILEWLARCGATVLDLSAIAFVSPLSLAPAGLPGFGGDGPALGGTLRPVYSGDRTVAVSSACMVPETAVKWLDIGYSDAGHLLYNYGVPGVTYRMEKGVPVLTDETEMDFLSRAKQGNFSSTDLFTTSRGLVGGPYVSDPSLAKLVSNAAFLKTAGDPSLWSTRGTEPVEHYLNQYPREKSEFNALITPIRRHVFMNFAAFISGQRPLEEFESFQIEIEEMGIGRAIELLMRSRNNVLAKRVAF